MLGISDAWATSHLSQRTRKPAYYIVDCQIFIEGGKRLEISGSDLKSQNMTQYFKFEIDWYPEKKTKFKLAMQIFVGKY